MIEIRRTVKAKYVVRCGYVSRLGNRKNCLKLFCLETFFFKFDNYISKLRLPYKVNSD